MTSVFAYLGVTYIHLQPSPCPRLNLPKALGLCLAADSVRHYNLFYLCFFLSLFQGRIQALKFLAAWMLPWQKIQATLNPRLLFCFIYKPKLFQGGGIPKFMRNGGEVWKAAKS